MPLSGNDVKYSNLGDYRPKELDKVSVTYINGKRKVTCFCGKEVLHSIVPHLKKDHSDLWDQWKRIQDKSSLEFTDL